MAPFFVLVIGMMTGISQAQPSEPRLRPPPAAECPRDHVTVYAGLVLRYRRGVGLTALRIRTDWDTTEDAAIKHPRSDDPSHWFLMEGKPFEPADWGRIEERPGKLRAGMRAAAWVCDDGRNPVVDWNPPRER